MRRAALSRGGWDSGAGDVLLLGAGGAGRAAVRALSLEGLKKLSVFETDISRAESLKTGLAAPLGMEMEILSSADALEAAVRNSGLLINATPVGLWPAVGSSPLPDPGWLSPSGLVFDMVPNPVETRLLREARLRGCRTVPGIVMLVAQALAADAVWLGRSMPDGLFETARPSASNTWRPMATLRILTAGESHGPALVGILEGMPAGLALNREKIDVRWPAARRTRPGRPHEDRDGPSGHSVRLRFGVTLGTPIAMTVTNRDWENWKTRMDPWSGREDDPGPHPRPGHVDPCGRGEIRAYRHPQCPGARRARETAVRVAIGAVLRQLLEPFGVWIGSHVIRIHGAAAGTTFRDLLEMKKPEAEMEILKRAGLAETSRLALRGRGRSRGHAGRGAGGRGKRRHGGRRLRSGRVERPDRPGIARHVGPPAGRPHRRGRDEHPRDQISRNRHRRGCGLQTRIRGP